MYSGGYAKNADDTNHKTQYPKATLNEKGGAKDKCFEMGKPRCQAVTCDSKDMCTLRHSPNLTESPTGEVTYTHSCGAAPGSGEGQW